MLVELKNGETLNGHLVQCDTWMNLTLKEVIQTSPEGDKFVRLPEVYIKGNNSPTKLSTSLRINNKTSKEASEEDAAAAEETTEAEEAIEEAVEAAAKAEVVEGGGVLEVRLVFGMMKCYKTARRSAQDNGGSASLQD
ncbi:RNA processing protein [Apiospora rasikravindrae]|uniref:LSM complex subunit LSM4 n=1 Tax=Apiospora rasikravindrae TaxID=990691 RepID=A0ABR1U267_9PEZI